VLFQSGNLKVRELELKDNYLLAKWLSDPTVLQYYEGRDNPFDLEKVNKIFYTPEVDEVRWIIEYEEIAIGYIQFYQLDQQAMEEYGYTNLKEIIFGTDQFIGEPKFWNKGIGKMLINSMVEYLIHTKHADKVVMDPQTWNERAIHCYEKCGFRKVKLLPKHEFHEGDYRDSWLIEYRKSI